MEIRTIVLAIIEFVLLGFALYDLFNRKFNNLAFGLVWLLIILMFPIIGPALYLYLRKGMSSERPRVFNPQFHRVAEKKE